MHNLLKYIALNKQREVRNSLNKDACEFDYIIIF